MEMVHIPDAQHTHVAFKTVDILNKNWGRGNFCRIQHVKKSYFLTGVKDTRLLSRLWHTDPLANRLHTTSHKDSDKTDYTGSIFLITQQVCDTPFFSLKVEISGKPNRPKLPTML